MSAEQVYAVCSIGRQGTVGTYVGITKLIFESGDPGTIDVGTSYHVTGDNTINDSSYVFMEQPSFLNPAGTTEYDATFNFPLSVYGGCDTALISAQSQYGRTSYDQDGPMCWAATVCHLTVTVDSGGYLSPGDPTGDYDCKASITLAEFALENYVFAGWSGDVTSNSPVVTVQMAGQNRSATASFQYVQPPPDKPPGPLDGCGDDCSPIVINFAKGDYELTGRNSPVLFDIGATGYAVRIGWTAAGADEAFLWLDRNGNGSVDSGAELFGTATPLQNGTNAKNGFEALRELDSNGDGVIDAHDTAWPRLMLWRDFNHDGRSDPSEITPIAKSGVFALSLTYHWTGRLDMWGNMFRFESLVWLEDQGGHMRAKPVYDIFFVPIDARPASHAGN